MWVLHVVCDQWTYFQTLRTHPRMTSCSITVYDKASLKVFVRIYIYIKKKNTIHAYITSVQ